MGERKYVLLAKAIFSFILGLSPDVVDLIYAGTHFFLFVFVASCGNIGNWGSSKTVGTARTTYSSDTFTIPVEAVFGLHDMTWGDEVEINYADASIDQERSFANQLSYSQMFSAGRTVHTFLTLSIICTLALFFLCGLRLLASRTRLRSWLVCVHGKGAELLWPLALFNCLLLALAVCGWGTIGYLVIFISSN